MSYWEQTAVANMRHRERLARMTPSQRRAREIALTTISVSASIILWAMIILPPVLMAIRHLR